MKSIPLHHTSSIRFRRWSRKSYAVFCSLSAVVTIGSLAFSVADKATLKSDNAAQLSSFISENIGGGQYDADADSELLQQEQEVILISTTNESAAAACSICILLT